MNNEVLTPIERLMADVGWVEVEPAIVSENDDLPVATHTGVLSLSGITLKCYKLSNGETILDADDFEALFEFVGDRQP